MTPSNQIQRFAIVFAMIAVAVASRLLPHPPNFTPLAAMALFAGAVAASPWILVLAVMGAMLISDAVIGFHPMMPFVYGCLLANFVIGSRWVRSNGSAFRVVGGSLMGSVLFFLVTNFAVWISFYPATWSGLTACYTAAIPFFQFTLAGDLVYSGLFFGAYALASHRWPAISMGTPVKAVAPVRR